MPMYVARWPDGTFTVAYAPNKVSLFGILDETGDPHRCEVHTITHFGINLRAIAGRDYDCYLDVEIADGLNEEFSKVLDNIHPTASELRDKLNVELDTIECCLDLHRINEIHGDFEDALDRDKKRACKPGNFFGMVFGTSIRESPDPHSLTAKLAARKVTED